MKDPGHKSRIFLPRNLDEAIELCIVALESDDQDKIRYLFDSCPQWQSDLEEFMSNWGGMERFAELVSSDDVQPDENQSGIQIGDYRLIEQIGSGGMGVIYKAHQLSLDRLVALKMINREQTDRERFQIEAEAIAALTHSNIVQVFEIGEHEGRSFFSMQLIEGCNLKDFRKRNKVSTTEAASITQLIARAVHYAHQRGILHRDLKPANVLMDPDGQPHITDFGLAKHLERDKDLTVSGAIIGTPAYMAPEQAAGQAKNLTMATDVYGLGAILYALLTGQAPFSGESSLEIIRKVVDQPPSSPRIHNREVGRDLETICLKCLEKAPELRYASAAELADDLQLYLSGQPVNARPVPQLERVWRLCVRNPIVSALTVAVVLLLISTSVTAIFLAISERNARVMSEKGEREKLSLQLDIEQEKRKKQNALQLADRNKTNLYLTNGQRNMLNGNHAESLLWYSHVADRLQVGMPDYEENLTRSNSLLNNLAVPSHAIKLDAEFHDIPWGFNDFAELDSKGRRALIQVGDNFYVWEFDTGETTLLNQLFADITCARFCSSAERIVIGSSDNMMLFVEPDTFAIEKEFELKGPASGVAVSDTGKWVGVSFDNQIAVWDVDREQFIDQGLEFDSAVEHVDFNERTQRALVVYQDEKGGADKPGRIAAITELIAIENSSVKSIAKIPCRMLKRQHFRYPNRRPFWPVFTQNGDSVMVRTITRINFHNAMDGAKIQHFFSEASDFSFSASKNGEFYAVGKQGMAAIRRVLHEPPSDEKATKEFMRLVHDGQVVEAIVSPKNIVATCNLDGVIKLWHLHESQFSKPCDDVPKVLDQKQCLFEIPHQGLVRRMVFSDDGDRLMTIQADGLVRVWSLPDYAKQIQEIEVAKGGALAKRVDENRWMVSGLSKWTSRINAIRCFDSENGEQVGGTSGELASGDGFILDSAVSPSVDKLVSIHRGETSSSESNNDSTAGYVRFWSFPDGERLSEKIPLPTEPRSVAFHPQGHQIAVVTNKMEVLLFDATTFELEATFSAKDNSIDDEARPMKKFNGQLTYSPDGLQMMTWGCGDKLCVWNIESQNLQFPAVSNSDREIEWAEYSNDGKIIAIAMGRSGQVRTICSTTGEAAGPELSHPSSVISARFDKTGDNLITACEDGRARIFDWRSGAENEFILRHGSRLVDASFTPDWKHIVTLDADQNLYIWNARSGELAMSPIRVPHGAGQILVTDNSRRLIIGGGLRRMLVIRLDHLYDHSIPV